MKATEQLDYETSPMEKFKIVVVDQSGDSCNSDIFLTLDDVNDNAPQFDQDLHMATVRENASQSVVIAQVRIQFLERNLGDHFGSITVLLGALTITFLESNNSLTQKS